jgi:hypothetical protein
MSQPSSESYPQMLKFIFLKCCPEIFLNYNWGTFHPIFLYLTSCTPCDVTDLQLTCEKLVLNFGRVRANRFVLYSFRYERG